VTAKKRAAAVARITTIVGKRHTTATKASAKQYAKTRSALISKDSKVGKSRFD
jgi:hypothetical protein